MERYLNTAGVCNPQRHYMVDIQRGLEEIKALVDRGEYFTINRARQYGKTTTLLALTEYLKKDYVVVSLDFQKMENADFVDEHTFSLAFFDYFLRTLRNKRNPIKGLNDKAIKEMDGVIQQSVRFPLRKLFI